MAQDPELDFVRMYEFDDERLVAPFRHLTLRLETSSPRAAAASFSKGATLDDVALVVARIPSLTKIEFDDECPANLINVAVLSKAARVRSLSVGLPCEEATLRAIGKMTNLDELTLHDLRASDFRELRRLESLHDLGFTVRHERQVSLEGLPWQSLRALAIDGTEKTIVDIRCNVGKGVLENLALETQLVGDFSVFKECPLKTIWHRGGNLTAHQIESLATIRTMEAFDGTKSTPVFSDSQVTLLLESWPSLQRLCFRGGNLRPKTLQAILGKMSIRAVHLIAPISPEYLPMLKEAKHLRDLTIFNSSRWSDAQRKQLSKDLPSTEITYLDR